MNKKAFQMSLSVIISAILALIVLVSVSYVFTDIFGEGATQLRSCDSRNGICVSEGDCQTMTITGKCPDEKVCCFYPESDDDDNEDE